MVANRTTHQICPSESVTRRTVRFSSLVTANTILRYLRASINFTETPLFCSCSMLLISMLENLNFVLFDRFNNSGAINVKMYGSVLKEKSTFKVLALAFSSKLDWSSYFVSIAKNECLQESWSLDSFYEVSFCESALYFYKSISQPCMKYCCHVRVNAPSCYLDMLDNYRNGYVGLDPSRAVFFEPLAHRRNMATILHKIFETNLLNSVKTNFYGKSNN